MHECSNEDFVAPKRAGFDRQFSLFLWRSLQQQARAKGSVALDMVNNCRRESSRFTVTHAGLILISEFIHIPSS
jgi:hypothetical protein